MISRGTALLFMGLAWSLGVVAGYILNEPESPPIYVQTQPVFVEPVVCETGNFELEQEILHLATTMWGEARNQGSDGMRAVGHVIKNRSEDGRWGSSVEEAAFAHRQFSVWNEGDPNRVRILQPSGNEWLMAQHIAREILTGRSIDPTAGRLFYHTHSIDPYWASYGVNPIRIGSHIFYEDVRQANT